MSVRYLSQNGNSYTNLFAYDDADRTILEAYPNGGPTITNVYDSAEHLSEVQLVGGSGTTFYAARVPSHTLKMRKGSRNGGGGPSPTRLWKKVAVVATLALFIGAAAARRRNSSQA